MVVFRVRLCGLLPAFPGIYLLFVQVDYLQATPHNQADGTATGD